MRAKDDIVFYKMLRDKNLDPHISKKFDLQAYYDAGVIKKDDLIDGIYYQGLCRNADVAKWDAKNNCFWYIRDRDRRPYKEKINHLADDNGWDLFVPFIKLDDKDVKDNERIHEQQNTSMW